MFLKIKYYVKTLKEHNLLMKNKNVQKFKFLYLLDD